jgi:hypothetical protein
MTTIKVRATVDENGVLKLGLPAGEYDVVATPASADDIPFIHPDWPPGYFTDVIGVVDDFSFRRPEQPVVEAPPKWW